MKNTKMYVMTETSLFMMSYVFITNKGNCIIVDGGRIVTKDGTAEIDL